MNAAVGSFLSNTSTGNQAVTGLGFQPKLLIFYGGRGADPQGNYVDADFFIGAAASSTARWACEGKSRDNLASSDNNRAFKSTACIIGLSTATTIEQEADFVSMDSDGFTVNWVTAAGTQRRIFYVALGGADLSVNVGTFDMNASTGNQAVTGVGFLPVGVLFARGITNGVTEGAAADATTMVGFAKSSTARCVMTHGGGDARNPMENRRYQRTASCIARCIGSSTTVQHEADFVSLDSDGFTINVTTAPTAATRIGYIALAGVNFAVGSFNQPSSTGNQAITGVGFLPKVVMFMSFAAAAVATVQTNARSSFGAAVSSSARLATAYATAHAGTPSVADKRTSEALSITHITEGTPTVDAEADFVSQDSDGFTNNWTTADATARQELYLAIGEIPAGATDQADLERRPARGVMRGASRW